MSARAAARRGRSGPSTRWRPGSMRDPLLPLNDARGRPGLRILWLSTLCTASSSPPRWRPSGRPPGASTAPPRGRWPATGGGPGSGPLHRRPCDQRRRRPEEAGPSHRGPRLPSLAPCAPAAPTAAAIQRRPGRGSTRSGRQALTALAPASGQDGPPGPRRHAVAEPMALRPLAGVRLVRALHSCPPRAGARPRRLACRRAAASATSGADQARGRGGPGPNADFPLCRKGVAVLRSAHARSCGTPSRSSPFPGDLVVPPAHVQPGVVHTCGSRCGQSTGRGGVRASGKGRRPVA